MRKNKTAPARPVFSRKTVISLLLAAIITAGALYLLHVLMRQEVFRIREVIVREAGVVLKDRSADFRYLLGKNIFSVDLRRHARQVAALNPVYRKARIIRYLPDRICVDLLKRSVLAVLDPQRRLCIDEQMVVFEDDSVVPAAVRPPLIEGFRRSGSCSRAGYKCSLPEIVFAAALIRQARPLAIERIVVDGSVSADLYLAGGIEVKIVSDGLGEKLAFLRNLLSQMGRDTVRVEYIDLRFKEPVIKFKQGSQRTSP